MKRFELLIPPPIIAFMVMIIQYVAYKFLPVCSFYWAGSKIISITLILIGFSIATAGIITFKKNATTSNPKQPELSSKIISSGIYKISRNPMYFGIFIGLLGVGLYLENGISILSALLFLIYITQFQIKPEEKILSHKFGEKYHKYVKATRRWI